MTLLPSSSTHRTLSLPRTRGHATPCLQLPSLPSLSSSLLALQTRELSPLPTPRSTLCVPLSRRASLSLSLSPSPLFLFRSVPFLPPNVPSPFPFSSPSSAAYLSDSRPLLLFLFPSRTLSLPLPPRRPEGFPQNRCRDNHRRLTTERRIVDRIVGRDKPPSRIRL